jgi:anti-anti-sigma factor
MDVQVSTDGSAATIILVGELDIANAEQVFSAATSAGILDKPFRVVIDLSRLTFCDSSGPSVFVRLRHHLVDLGGDLSMVGAAGIVARSIAITGLGEHLNVTGPSTLRGDGY